MNGLIRPSEGAGRATSSDLSSKRKQARIPHRVEQVRLNVDTERVQRWKAAADAERLDLTAWLVAAADNAARRAAVVPLAAGTGDVA